jgi:hypothetical protein
MPFIRATNSTVIYPDSRVRQSVCAICGKTARPGAGKWLDNPERRVCKSPCQTNLS